MDTTNAGPMNATARCPQCGVVLPQDAPWGLCPPCLLRAGRELVAEPASPAMPEAPVPGPPSVLDRGRHFGDYELLEEIARGGMGVVFKARQVSLNRIVAVKMIRAGRLASAVDVQRFRKEAEAAAHLQHPHIVAIHDVGAYEGQHYFSMDYVEGQALGELVRDRPLPAARAAGYVRTIAETIHYAHRQGILHRDLKPSNILIDALDQPRITDFGLAQRLDAEVDLTRTGEILGSPNFMAPEQAAGKRGGTGPQSDVYGLGAILYHMLASRPPFVAETPQEVLDEVRRLEPPALRVLNPHVPRDLETICLKCLEKDPQRRYASAQALADELGRFLRGEPIRARPVGPAGRLWRWCRRQPAMAGLAGAVLLLLITIAVGASVAAARLATARDREATLRRIAEAERQRALDRELAARQSEYAADMGLAQQALADRNLRRALELIEKHRPVAGHPDLRGWEWRYLWQQTRSEEVLALRVGPAWLGCVAVAPDGQCVATGTADGQVRLWDLHTRRQLAAVNATGLDGLTFSPDGRWLACRAVRGTVQVWEVPTLRPVATLDHAAHAFCFAPDSLSLDTADLREVRRWTIPDGNALTRKPLGWDTGQARNVQLTLAPGARWVALGSLDAGPKIWDLTANRQQAAFPRTGHVLVFRLAFSPDGEHLAAGHTDGSIGLWSTAEGRLLHTFEGHNAFVTALAFSANGQLLATGSYDQTIALWNTRSGKLVRRYLGHRNGLVALAFSPDGQRLVSGSHDGTIRVWETGPRPDRDSLHRFPFVAPHCRLAPDRQGAVACSWEGAVQLWSAAPGGKVARFSAAPSNTTSIAVSAGGAMLALGTRDGSIRLWSTTPDGWSEVAALAAHTDQVGRVTFSPDSRRLASAGSDRQIVIWNLATRQASGRLASAREVEALEFSADGTCLGIGYAGSDADLWVHGSSRSPTRLTGHRASVLGVAISHDHRMAATASFDHTVKLWDIRAAPQVRELATLTGSLTPAWSVAFCPDDARLAVGLGDGEIRLWNVRTGHEALRLKGHKLPVFGVGFTPQGHALVAVSGDAFSVWRAASLAEADDPEPTTTR